MNILERERALDIPRLMAQIFGEWEEGYPLPTLAVVESILATLPERERYVVLRHFASPKETLKQIAKTAPRLNGALGMTPEMVRSLELRALRKLRHPTRSRLFRYNQAQLASLEHVKFLIAKESAQRAERRAHLWQQLSERGLPPVIINALLRHGYVDIDMLRDALMGGLPKIRNIGAISIQKLRVAFDLEPSILNTR